MRVFLRAVLVMSSAATSCGAMREVEGRDNPQAEFPSFTVTSKSLGTAFTAEQFWNSFGCTGQNGSPDIAWSGFPAETKSFAVTVYDQDAPTGSGFWHWVAYNIPANVNSLAAGAASSKQLPSGTVEGNTDLGQPGYFGPCPPVGRQHRYVFTVTALKVEKLDLPATATAAFIGFNLWQNTLARASLSATAGPRQ
jgi:Raf kinase inhibitor-like YbhB/YbcL family protein